MTLPLRTCGVLYGLRAELMLVRSDAWLSDQELALHREAIAERASFILPSIKLAAGASFIGFIVSTVAIGARAPLVLLPVAAVFMGLWGLLRSVEAVAVGPHLGTLTFWRELMRHPDPPPTFGESLVLGPIRPLVSITKWSISFLIAALVSADIAQMAEENRFDGFFDYSSSFVGGWFLLAATFTIVGYAAWIPFRIARFYRLSPVFCERHGIRRTPARRRLGQSTAGFVGSHLVILAALAALAFAFGW